MARTPRRRQTTPLSADETEQETEGNSDTSQEVDETEKSYEDEIPQPETQDTQEEIMDLEQVTAEEFDTYLDALERLSMEQLIQVITAAQHKRAEKQDEVREQLLEEFRERARVMGISLDSLFPLMSGGGMRRGGKKPPVAVKYRGPNGEGWSGRGVTPRWMQALIDTGNPKADFFIQQDGKTEWERKQQEVA